MANTTGDDDSYSESGTSTSSSSTFTTEGEPPGEDELLNEEEPLSEDDDGNPRLLVPLCERCAFNIDKHTGKQDPNFSRAERQGCSRCSLDCMDAHHPQLILALNAAIRARWAVDRITYTAASDQLAGATVRMNKAVATAKQALRRWWKTQGDDEDRAVSSKRHKDPQASTGIRNNFESNLAWMQLKEARRTRGATEALLDELRAIHTQHVRTNILLKRQARFLAAGGPDDALALDRFRQTLEGLDDDSTGTHHRTRLRRWLATDHD